MPVEIWSEPVRMDLKFIILMYHIKLKFFFIIILEANTCIQKNLKIDTEKVNF